MKKILITGDIPDDAYLLLKKKHHVVWNKASISHDQLLRAVKPCQGLLTLIGNRIDALVMEAAPRLQCIANYGVGYNNIDVVEAKKRGIVVTNTPDVLTDATADIAWALILACSRRIPEGEAMVRNKRFKDWHAKMLLGRDLRGKTLGIFGFGRIGQAIARRASGWEMPVLYHQRHPIASSLEKNLRARFVSFETLLKRSDILSVNAPLTPLTRHRFTRREFNRMKEGAIFINTARGLLHDEKDLAMALKSGRLFSAGLDVYENEPQVHPDLLKRPNSTLLPHLGSATRETRAKMALLAAQNLQEVLAGHKPLTPVC